MLVRVSPRQKKYTIMEQGKATKNAKERNLT